MIDINNVYQTVLTILNKEQRGYLDDEEFSNLAKLAQREIFEAYFLSSLQTPDQGMAVANPQMFLDEKISYFEEYDQTLTSTNNSYFAWPDNLYRLGVVSEDGIIIDRVSHKDIRYINLSPLTAPTVKQPVYVIKGKGIQVYPPAGDDTHTIEVNYIRVPIDPSITYTLDNDTMEQVLDTQVDFELHPSEFQDLVIKICAYAGVVVRAAEVTQFAQQAEQQLKQSEV